MSTRNFSQPKRRGSNSMLPPPKTSKMSAEAPVFQPRPKMEEEDPAVAASAASAPNPSVTTGEGGQIHGGAKEIDSDTREKLNAAVAASRVTRPLPGSRRPAAAANMVPQAATTVKTGEEKENRRRLIVVLSQVGIKDAVTLFSGLAARPRLAESSLGAGLPRFLSICQQR